VEKISEILTAQIARYLCLKWKKQVFEYIAGMVYLTLNLLNFRSRYKIEGKSKLLISLRWN